MIGGGTYSEAVADDLGDQFAKRIPILQAERVGLAQRLPHRTVSRRRTSVGPLEQCLHQADLVLLVDEQQGVRVVVPRHVVERQR